MTDPQTDDTTAAGDDLAASAPVPPADQSTQIADLQAQLGKMTDLAARAQADLQNFKARTTRENAEYRAFANVPLLMELLHIYDDLTRAASHEGTASEGLMQILSKLQKILADAGVIAIPAFGLPVDPHLHEIVNAAPGAKDIITLVHQEGFTLNGRVLRPAKVQVGNGEIGQKMNS